MKANILCQSLYSKVSPINLLAILIMVMTISCSSGGGSSSNGEDDNNGGNGGNGNGGGGLSFSCLYGNLFCFDFIDVPAADLAEAKASCTEPDEDGFAGQLVSSCSKANAVDECSGTMEEEGVSIDYKIVIYSPIITCEMFEFED